VLIHQVNNKSYEKYLLNQANFDTALPAELQAQASLAVKDLSTTIIIAQITTETSETEDNSRTGRTDRLVVGTWTGSHIKPS